MPGSLAVTATAGTAPSDVTGFIVLTRGTDVRRIPFFFYVSAPRLAAETRTPLLRGPAPTTGRRTARLRASASTATRPAAT